MTAEKNPPLNTPMIVGEVNKIIATYESKLTLRQIYYRLVAKNIIPNNLNSYKALGNLLVKARETKKVDANKIEDRGRITIGGDYAYKTPEDYYERFERDFRNCPKNYRLPVWTDQKYYVEVWVEKDALSKIVSEIADSLGVITCVARGYSSFSFVNNAAKRIEAACQYPDDGVEKNPVILYFGDFDPSGEDMVRDLEVRLLKYGMFDWVPCDEFSADPEQFVHKLALTPEQIKTYGLPPAPVKMTDGRATKFIEKYGTDVVELDSLDPKLLQEFIRRGIREYLDEDILLETINRQEEEQTKVTEMVENHFGVVG